MRNAKCSAARDEEKKRSKRCVEIRIRRSWWRGEAKRHRRASKKRERETTGWVKKGGRGRRWRWSDCISEETEKSSNKEQRRHCWILHSLRSPSSLGGERRETALRMKARVLVVKSLMLAMVLFRRKQYVYVLYATLYRNVGSHVRAFHRHAYVNVRILELYGGT